MYRQSFTSLSPSSLMGSLGKKERSTKKEKARQSHPERRFGTVFFFFLTFREVIFSWHWAEEETLIFQSLVLRIGRGSAFANFFFMQQFSTKNCGNSCYLDKRIHKPNTPYIYVDIFYGRLTFVSPKLHESFP